MYDEPFWYQDCIAVNDCSLCPWGARDVNGLKRCEQDIQEIEDRKESNFKGEY